MLGVDRGNKATAHRFRAPVIDFKALEIISRPSPVGSFQHGLLKHAEILACPRCGGRLECFLEILECKWCGTQFQSDGGLPRLFFPHDVLYGPRDVTQAVNAFYDSNPFPKYEETDSAESLRHRMERNPVAQLLNEHIPGEALLLDAGCGTGQLANFLGLRKTRQVIGADLSLACLRHAKRFKDRAGNSNSAFLQMNLFRPPFKTAVFDVVIANSVLHHTSDPLRGFRTLSNLLKPGGLFVLGLYSPLGRFATSVRRLFFSLSNDRMAFLKWRSEKQRARFIHRYKQPWESKHLLGEVVNEWFFAHEFEFLYSHPRIGSQTLNTGDNGLRYPRWPGDRTMQMQTELGMMMRGIVNDGLFVMIGRKCVAPKRIESGLLAEAAVA